MKATYVIFSFTFLLTGFVADGQRNDNWYFGARAALSFNPPAGQPVPAALPNSVMVADECSASISDEDGKLLFYTNGITVYNKVHQQMLNGYGLNGNISTVQIAIVPVPGNDSIFYIFTADAIEDAYLRGYQ